MRLHTRTHLADFVVQQEQAHDHGGLEPIYSVAAQRQEGRLLGVCAWVQGGLQPRGCGTTHPGLGRHGLRTLDAVHVPRAHDDGGHHHGEDGEGQVSAKQ